MSRICGYRCEHNKSGICQISVCDKKSNISDKTEVQTFTRYIDPTITELQQENRKQKEIINEAISIINEHFKHHPELFTENQREYDLIRKIEHILKGK